MEYNKQIADMTTGDRVEGFYILKEAYLKVSSNGKPFLSAVIGDKSGTVDIKVWDYNGPVGADPADVGKVIKIRGMYRSSREVPRLPCPIFVWPGRKTATICPCWCR